MKEIFKINEEEFGFSESRLVEGGYVCEEPWTDVSLPQPCWKPKFDWKINAWIEKATEEEMNPPVKEELSEVQQLAQALIELELDNFEKDNRINELEKENQLLGQESTDHDLRLIELEGKLDV